MKKLLLVEDMKFFNSLVEKHVRRNLDIDVVSCTSYAEAVAVLKNGFDDYFLAILDLNLPDAPDGQIVDLVIGYGIPSVVFSAQFSEDTRDQILSKNVIDYVVKQNPSSLDYLVSLISRLYFNANVKVLVVDDSTTARKYVMDLMKRYQFKVEEAENGIEALEILEKHPDIRLVITDYNMPQMDGFELTREIRRKYPKHKIGIIGLSTAGSNILSAQFIKNGANDFLNKPFLREEFFCRVCQNVELIEYMDDLKSAATHDFLTGLHNRRFLNDIGSNSVARALRDDMPLSVALLDIDHFSKINNEYGHSAGDEILIQLGELLNERCRRSDVLARTGGEELCIIANNLPAHQCHDFFDGLRHMIEKHDFKAGQKTLKLTVSIGVCNHVHESFDAMIASAEEALLYAKNEGRNRTSIQTN
ncbi:diguanylate cyclase [Terasakiella brassicae]|uniref:diguanylate cyclase n=1 Tax=Terasakiella brassicae TaxID=1634917 RepID=A0A917FDY2_9PROT|nr:diguanylate cyclase [Terasakiella brassicae]GGF66251.1 diguanylate cyclase [Terasakiella brassicae]